MYSQIVVPASGTLFIVQCSYMFCPSSESCKFHQCAHRVWQLVRDDRSSCMYNRLSSASDWL